MSAQATWSHGPWPIWTLFGVLLVGLLATAGGVALSLSRSLALRLLGKGVTLIGGLLLVYCSLAAFKAGVAWDASAIRGDTLPTLVFSIVPILFLLAVAVRLWMGRHESAP